MVFLLFQNISRAGGGKYLSWKFLKKTHDQTQNVLIGKRCCSISWELQISYVLFVPVYKVCKSDVCSGKTPGEQPPPLFSKEGDCRAS